MLILDETTIPEWADPEFIEFMKIKTNEEYFITGCPGFYVKVPIMKDPYGPISVLRFDCVD